MMSVSLTRARREPRRQQQREAGVWRRLLSDWHAQVAIAYLACLIVLAVAAPVIAPYSPVQQDINAVLLPPDAAHLLGTDDLGRDVFSRLIYGAPTSLYASCLAVSVAIVLGLPFGLFIGYVGGWVDEAGSRLIDTLLSFPGIVLAIGVTGALGIGITHAMIAVGIVYAPVLARVARAQTLIVKQGLFVTAAQSFGASTSRIIIRHILPNAIQPVIVQITLLLSMALLAEASLSFLGLGVQPPQPSWGGMLAKAYGYMEIAPEQTYSPGIAILLTALAFSQLGEALRRALDPSGHPAS